VRYVSLFRAYQKDKLKGEMMKTLDKVMTVIEDWCGRMAKRLF
jgi:hypothetical protein